MRIEIMLCMFILLSGIVMAIESAPSAEPTKLRFVVIGDVHVQEGGVKNTEKLAVEKIISEVKPSFVVQVGDLISIDDSTEAASAERVSQMWGHARKDIIDKLVSNGILFFYTPGNHDGIGGGKYASSQSKKGYADFWDSFKPLNKGYPIDGNYGKYYSFDVSGYHFIMLFAPGTAGLLEPVEQRAWLAQDVLKAKSSQGIFTFAHSPLFAPEVIGPHPKAAKFLQNDATFMKLIKEAGVKMHFAGHVHTVQEENIEGIRQLIVGNLGADLRPLKSTGNKPPYTFMVVDVVGNSPPVYYKVEAPSFKTDHIPKAPEAPTNLAGPTVPESLRGMGVCPPGTKLRSDVEVGAGVAPDLPVSSISSSVLDAAHRYNGREYGTASGQFVGSSLIEQVLKDVGVAVSDDMHKKIFLIGSPFAPESPLNRGVELALTELGIATTVSSSGAQPGDFIQYWITEGDSLKGRNGIIEAVKGEGVFDVFTASESGVGVLNDVKSSKVFIARLKPKQSASPSAGTATAGTTPASSAGSASSAAGCSKKIMLFGDSITVGYSSYFEKMYKEKCPDSIVISKERPHTGPGNPCDRVACVGRNVGTMLNEIGPVLEQYQPDTIVILGGTNDANAAWEKTRTKIEGLYSAAKSKNVRVVGVTIPPYKTEEYRRIKGETNAPSNINNINGWIMTSSPADIKVNIYDPLKSSTEEGSVNTDLFTPGNAPKGDGYYHPNSRGYNILAKAIVDVLSGGETTALSGATSSPAGQASGSQASGQAPIPALNALCVPEDVLSKTLFDFIINSSSGLTTVIGIARQNIAVGIDKKEVELTGDIRCDPISADKSYDVAFLRKTYGSPDLDVPAQIKETEFMSKKVKVHRLILTAVKCVEKEIKQCPEGKSYDYRVIDSYRRQALSENPDLEATSSFGISLDINMDTNPNSQNGQLVSDIPKCVIDAFNKYGFRWGGDNPTYKTPAHFEFMADPSRIALVSTCPEGMTPAVNENGEKICRKGDSAWTPENVPIAAGENKEAKIRFASAIKALGGKLPYNPEVRHPSCCGDWVAHVYKYSGYGYLYNRAGVNSLQELANKYGYPIGYNDDRGSQGHALILLGFGKEAEWWLEQFPDIPLRNRKVREDQALVISYYGSEAQYVGFNVYPRNTYSHLTSRMHGDERPAIIKTVHPLTPLCAGKYLLDDGSKRYRGKYAGQYYWSNNQQGDAAVSPWADYYIPTGSAFYPFDGKCDAKAQV